MNKPSICKHSPILIRSPALLHVSHRGRVIGVSDFERLAAAQSSPCKLVVLIAPKWLILMMIKHMIMKLTIQVANAIPTIPLIQRHGRCSTSNSNQSTSSLHAHAGLVSESCPNHEHAQTRASSAPGFAHLQLHTPSTKPSTLTERIILQSI